MFLKLFIAIYTEQHLNAAKNELGRLGYECTSDFHSALDQPVTHITTYPNGTYTIWTLDLDKCRRLAHANTTVRVINLRQLRGLHRRLRTSFSQDNHAKLEIVPVRSVNIFPELEKLSPLETEAMQSAIKWSAPKVPTPDVYIKLWYNTAISWTKAIIKRLVRHFK